MITRLSRIVGTGALFLLLSAFTAVGTSSEIRVWPVDPLIKIFPDTPPAVSEAAHAEVARGEHATFQIVVRSDSLIQGLRAETSKLTRRLAPGTLTPQTPRFVGYVPVDRPTQKPSKDQLRPPPADYPDPLLETETLDVPAAKAQAIWITVRVPTNAPAAGW